ncbi:MAG TPA: hypothetical protein VJ912_04345 [Candidatus Nanoarchaeia archaeon]|nr:hypothetical protein [Candidatus Nanoarchaeia archaeon]
MVKKSKKKSSKKNSKKNKKNTQTFLKNNKWAITAVLLFVVAFLLLGSFNFGEGANITGNQIFGGDGSVFGDGENTVSVGDGEYPFTQTGMDITKIIFFVIVILLIFSVLNITGIPHIVGLQWVFAILIGYLAVGYITPAEIFAMLSTYSALGLALISAVPFIVMMLASAAILSPLKKERDIDPKTGKVKSYQVTNFGKLTIGKILLVKILWAFFTLFLVYKIITGVFMEGQALGAEGVTVGAIILGVTLFFSILITFWNSKFRKMVMKFGQEIKAWQRTYESSEEMHDEEKKVELEENLKKKRRKAKEKGEYFGDQIGSYKG